ncbi:hypothetical protein Cni_G25451 [Canna indica]|uniref:Uncharacterized protein n=1 Tax=Canna indica TaxID=4628 RepID=A0AAQ3QPA2_9LILI|nr:hypothetical protein Cni_G25451 [Canna indica]
MKVWCFSTAGKGRHGNMHIPLYSQAGLTNANCQPSSESMRPNVLPASTGYKHGNDDVGLSAQRSNSLVRHQFQSIPGVGKRGEFNNQLPDPEIVELHYKSRLQEEEILLLRKQITDACTTELQLLNEKHILERRLSELRIALDEKQDDAIASALKELTKKRSYVEENLRLTNDLQVAEEETFMLTSSLLSLLAEYDIRPSQITSSTITYGVKQLYQHMHWKLKSYGYMEDMNHHLGNQPDNLKGDKYIQATSSSRYQLSHAYMEPTIPEVHLYDQYPMYMHGKGIVKMDLKGVNVTPSSEMPYPAINEKSRDLPYDIYKEVGGVPNPSQGHVDAQFPMATMPVNQGSFISEGEYDLPGIEGFQVYGEAKPGSKLQACGYPTNGTTLCIFQWLRELDNGTRQYIEGASVPEYVVTADDVDTILAVECTPIDDSGQQGDLVRQFANNQNKITCDPEMQNQIDSYISAGKAIFNVKVLEDSSNWEQTVLILKRSTYQINVKRSDGGVIEGKYSSDLEIKVPLGYTTQFVLTCPDGRNVPLSTDGACQPYSSENDVRLRDIIVLTMRYFQSKVIDTKRKVKA